MEKIPTAEDVMIPYSLYDNEDKDLIKSAMIEFAKLHVEAALKNASEKVELTDEVCDALQGHWFKEYTNKKSILNSYPLENIK